VLRWHELPSYQSVRGTAARNGTWASARRNGYLPAVYIKRSRGTKARAQNVNIFKFFRTVRVPAKVAEPRPTYVSSKRVFRVVRIGE